MTTSLFSRALPSDRFCLWFAAVLDIAMALAAIGVSTTAPLPWWWWASWAAASGGTAWTWINRR